MKTLLSSLVVLLVLGSSLFLVGCGTQTLEEKLNYLEVKKNLNNNRHHIAETNVSSNLANVPTKDLQEWLKEVVNKKVEDENHFDRYKNEKRMLGEKITYDWWLPVEIMQLDDRANQIADELTRRKGNMVLYKKAEVIIIPSSKSGK